jgi:hypothetical protein
MCIIVDANVAADVFTAGGNPNSDFHGIASRLFDKDDAGVCLSYGGTSLRNEYARVRSVWRIVVELDRQGRLDRADDADVDAEECEVEPFCESDDPPIIALARSSEGRVLCSYDRALHQDFVDRRLVSNPRGNVYQNADHQHRINKHCC